MSICVLKIQNVGRSNLAIRQVYFEDNKIKVPVITQKNMFMQYKPCV